MHNKSLLIISSILIVFILILSCGKEDLIDEMIPESTTPIRYPDAIPASPQKTGDASAGWEFLRYGNYVGSGLPLELYTIFFQQKDEENLLERDGDNATIAPSFVAFNIGDKRVVGGTCFTCHGSKLDGEYIPGLGNSFSDYTTDQVPILFTQIVF